MKKYLKILPLILYPYINLICIVLFFVFMLSESEASKILLIALGIVAAIFQIVTLSTSIISTVKAIKSERSAKDAAKLNLMIKLCHIPAYVFVFVVGFFSFFVVGPQFGIVPVFFAFLIDALTIIMSGTFALSCAAAFRKEEILSPPLCVLTAVLSYLFCVDVATAAYYFFKSTKPVTAAKNMLNNLSNSESEGDIS